MTAVFGHGFWRRRTGVVAIIGLLWLMAIFFGGLWFGKLYDQVREHGSQLFRTRRVVLGQRFVFGYSIHK